MIVRFTNKIDDINKYKTAKRQTIRLVKQVKTTYIKEQDNKWGDDSKKCWDIVEMALSEII